MSIKRHIFQPQFDVKNQTCLSHIVLLSILVGYRFSFTDHKGYVDCEERSESDSVAVLPMCQITDT